MQDKALVRRLIDEVWNQGRFEAVDELVAEDYVGHSPTSETETHGKEGYKQFFAMLRSAFPDVQFTAEQVLSDGEFVVARWTARGTHLGPFVGIPATSRVATVTGITTYRMVGRQVAECWTNADDLGVLRQRRPSVCVEQHEE
jgi:steroid delta-isomerase-like uncharacterized protein